MGATSVNLSVAANKEVSDVITPTAIENYTPFAIAGWSLGSSQSIYCTLKRCYITNTGLLNYVVANPHTVNATPLLTVYVLYKLNLE